MTRRAGPLPLLVLAIALATAHASAAPPPKPLSKSLSGEAKSEFDAARVLYEDGDYAGALVKYQHAFDLAGDPRLLWNMAACEKALRHYGKARALVQKYTTAAGPTMSDDDKKSAREFMDATATFVSTLVVDVNEPDAEIFLDDERVGVSPLAAPLQVDLGTHKVRVKKAGFVEVIVQRQVSGSDEIRLTVQLSPEQKLARVSIAAETGDAISIDGRAVGSGRWEGSVPAGQHVVEVSRSGAQTFHADLSLGANETRSLYVTLQTEKKGGISPWVWIVGGVVAAAGAGVGGYFLFKKDNSPSGPQAGSIPPGTVQLP